MAKPKTSAANALGAAAARKAAAAAASTTTPAPIDPAATTTPAPIDPAATGTPAPKPKVPGRGNKVTQNMRDELMQRMKAADPNADVSAVATMDVRTLGETLDRYRSPDPISTDAELADIPPDPIVVPKKGRRKPKAAAATDTTPAPLPKTKKKQARDAAKGTYTKPTGPMPEAPQRKPRATTSSGDEGPPPPVNQGTEARFGQYDPAVMLGRLGLKGLYNSPTGMIAGGVAGLYALNKLAQMGAAPPPAPPGGAPPMPPMPVPAPPGGGPPGGTPPVPFFPVGEEEEEEEEQYPPGDYRRYLPKQPPR